MTFKKELLCAKTIIQLYGHLISPELLNDPSFERCLDECLGTTENMGNNSVAIVTIKNDEISVVYPFVEEGDYRCTYEEKKIKMLHDDNGDYCMDVLSAKNVATNRTFSPSGFRNYDQENKDGHSDLNLYPVIVDNEYMYSRYVNGVEIKKEKYLFNDYKLRNNYKRNQFGILDLKDCITKSVISVGNFFCHPFISRKNYFSGMRDVVNCKRESVIRSYAKTNIGFNSLEDPTLCTYDIETYGSEPYRVGIYKVEFDKNNPSKIILGECIEPSFITHYFGNNKLKDLHDKQVERINQFCEEYRDEFLYKLEEIRETHPEIYEGYHNFVTFKSEKNDMSR